MRPTQWEEVFKAGLASTVLPETIFQVPVKSGIVAIVLLFVSFFLLSPCNAHFFRVCCSLCVRV
jgi:hypothetical protein